MLMHRFITLPVLDKNPIDNIRNGNTIRYV